MQNAWLKAKQLLVYVARKLDQSGFYASFKCRANKIRVSVKNEVEFNLTNPPSSFLLFIWTRTAMALNVV